MGDAGMLLFRGIGSGRTGDGTDDLPFVLGDDDRIRGGWPELDGDVVDPVSKYPGLDGQIPHALAKTYLATDGTTLDGDPGSFTDSLEHIDFNAKRIDQTHSILSKGDSRPALCNNRAGLIDGGETTMGRARCASHHRGTIQCLL